MEMRRTEVKCTLRLLYLQTKSFLPPLPTSCIVRKNQVFYTNYGHIIFLRDRIIFTCLFLWLQVMHFIVVVKFFPFVVHHIKNWHMRFFNSRLFRSAVSRSPSIYFNVVQIRLCFDSPYSKKVLEIFSFGSQLRFTSRHVLGTPKN
jgi:hypothetical protein